MIQRLLGGCALVSMAALGLVACGGDEPAAKGPSEAELAWAGKVCDTVKRSSATLQVPSVSPGDGAASKTALVKLLRDLSDRLNKQEAALRQAGAPPAAAAKTTYDKALADLGVVRGEVDTAAARLKKAEVTDQKSLNKSLGRAGQAMTKFGKYQGLVQSLRADPALQGAFTQAPTCKSLGV